MTKIRTLGLLATLVAVLGSPALSARDLAKGEWYLRLKLNSAVGNLVDDGNLLGQYRDAAPGPDRYDLVELGAFSGPYLSVIFYRPEWNQEDEDYGTDFHPVRKNKSDSWTFEVRSNDTQRDLTLRWEAHGIQMKGMVLVDLDSGEEIPALVGGAPWQYSFNMDGEAVRAFEWRVLSNKEQKLAQKSSDKDAKLSRKSDWQPQGWSRGNGQKQGAIAGLPEDPFAN